MPEALVRLDCRLAGACSCQIAPVVNAARKLRDNGCSGTTAAASWPGSGAALSNRRFEGTGNRSPAARPVLVFFGDNARGGGVRGWPFAPPRPHFSRPARRCA